MASTGNINASNQYITFVNGSRTESIGNSAFNFVDVPKKDGTAWMSIVIGDALIKYGTINKVTLTYRIRGHRSSTIYDKATARTGYTNTSGNIQWTTTHTKAVARSNEDASQFTDTVSNPTRDNNGQYRINVGAINHNSTVALTVYVLSISINIDYTPRQHTVKFVNYDGSVLQSTTMGYGSTPSYSGTPTKPADKENVYTFSGWDKTISTVTADVTYTAQFTATDRLYEIKVDCKPDSNSGLSCQATGAGMYKFGATVTIEATNIPSQHRFRVGEIYGKEWYWYHTNPFSFVIDDNITNNGAYGVITVGCYIEQIPTNTITTIVSPVDTGTIIGGGTYDYGSTVTLTAVAGDIYKFINWNDGVTDATRTITVLGDATYTAYFKLNAVFVDTSQSTGVYADTTEANEIYVDELKLYG